MIHAKRILAKGANDAAVRRFWNSAVRRSSRRKCASRDCSLRSSSRRETMGIDTLQRMPQASAWQTIEPRYEGGHYGTHEPPVQKLLVAYLKLGDCFYDIGAHTGFFSVLAAILVGRAELWSRSSRIGGTQCLLRETVARNSLGPNIAVVEQALSSFEGYSRFASAVSGPNSNTGMSKMVGQDLPGSYEVSCVTMDKLAETLRTELDQDGRGRGGG